MRGESNVGSLVANSLDTVLEHLHKRHASEDMLSEMNKLSAVIARRRGTRQRQMNFGPVAKVASKSVA